MIAENTIYEFDIKGFFDNISHEAIIKKVKETLGKEASEWVAQILKSSPMKYVLPPIEADKAALSFEKIRNEKFEDDWGEHSPTYEDWGFIGIHSYEDIPADTPVDQLDRYVLFSEMEGWDQAIAQVSKPIELKDKYKDLMNEGSFTRRVGNSITGEIQVAIPTEEDRALGRDKWKNLGQPDKGVPQGLGTSPFLSTFLTDTYLYELGTDRKALIMYMDDGILFARNKAEMEKLITRLKELLGALGLEMEPAKSRYVKIDGEWLDSVKFLGLRFLPKENTIMSDTRGGTKIKFPMNAEWDDVKTLAVLNNASISNIKEKYDRLINTTAYEAGLRYGFLGCLIAGSQYKENKSMEERREDIRKGQNSAWALMERSKGFIWKFQDLHNYTEYLTNITSIQVHKFMNLQRKGGKLYQYQGRKHRRELLK
jgi:hypothetical protein